MRPAQCGVAEMICNKPQLLTRMICNKPQLLKLRNRLILKVLFFF